MIDLLLRIYRILISGPEDAVGTYWQSVVFAREGFAVWAAILTVAAIFLKIAWTKRFGRKNRSSFVHSGYRFSRGHRLSIIGKLVLGLTGIFILIGGVSFFIALADPFVIETKKTTYQESRQVVYIRDVSTSLGYYFSGTQQLRSEVERDFLVKFISGRIDKNDQAAYIVFASDAVVVSRFTVDMKSVIFKVVHSHQIITDPTVPEQPYFANLFKAKDFTPIPYGGKTNLHLAITRAIRLFDEDLEKMGQGGGGFTGMRSVIIVTDGAAEENPEPQFADLRKKGITPYVILLDSHRESEMQIHGPDSPQVKLPTELFRLSRKHGGRSFRIDDPGAVDSISYELDKLHAIREQAEYFTENNHIYQRFLLISISCFLLVIVIRLVFERYFRVV